MCGYNMQLDIEPIILMEEVSLNCRKSNLKQQSVVVMTHVKKTWKTSQVYFISYLAPVSNRLTEVNFFQTELQDGSFDVLTESAPSCVFVFTCIYQQRYHEKTFLSRNYEKRSKVLQFWLWCSIFSADQAGVMISQKANTREIDFVNFIEEKFSFLNITALAKSVVEDSFKCAFSCLENLACFSFNVAAFPDKAGKFTCEILTSDKYNNSKNFLPSKTFHHFSIAVRINCLQEKRNLFSC